MNKTLITVNALIWVAVSFVSLGVPSYLDGWTKSHSLVLGFLGVAAILSVYAGIRQVNSETKSQNELRTRLSTAEKDRDDLRQQLEGANSKLKDAQKRLTDLNEQNHALSDALAIVPKERRGFVGPGSFKDHEVEAEEGGPLHVSGGETVRYALFMRTRRELQSNDYARLVIGDWSLTKAPEEFIGEIPIPIFSDGGSHGLYKPVRFQTSLHRNEWELAVSVHSHRL